MKQIEDGGWRVPLDLPVIEEGRYLLDAWAELGLSEISGENEVPLTWSEIYSYLKATGSISEPWECRAVRQMSEAYLQEKTRCKNPLAIPPSEMEE